MLLTRPGAGLWPVGLLVPIHTTEFPIVISDVMPFLFGIGDVPVAAAGFAAS